jgi:erythronate-4-phosphate dehydrogenase
MLRIIADDKIPYLKGVLEPYGEIEYLPGNKITRESAKNADALLIRTRTHCGSALLDGTSVRFIATATIGFDHIDTAYCQEQNIRWTNAPGCNSASVAQYITLALIQIAKFNKSELRGKTIGIVGVGNVGSKVAGIASAFGMKILLNDPPRARKEGTNNFVLLDELLAAADIVTLHVPLNTTGDDKTLHLFDEMMLGKMKPGASLINTSRGEVVETNALVKTLTNRRIAFTVLDVWENEPNINIQLMEKVLIATPHIAGYSADGKANGTALIVQALSRQFGLPLTDWFPADIPSPAEPNIFLDGNAKNTEKILAEALMCTYDIMADDHRLRTSPGTFEEQRGIYPLRREFNAYTVHAKNTGPSTLQVLKDLGFNVVAI